METTRPGLPACSKDLGKVSEKELPETLQLYWKNKAQVNGGLSDHARCLAYRTQMALSFSLRG